MLDYVLPPGLQKQLDNGKLPPGIEKKLQQGVAPELPEKQSKKSKKGETLDTVTGSVALP